MKNTINNDEVLKTIKKLEINGYCFFDSETTMKVITATDTFKNYENTLENNYYI